MAEPNVCNGCCVGWRGVTAAWQAELEMLRKVRAALEGLRQLLHKVKEVCRLDSAIIMIF